MKYHIRLYSVYICALLLLASMSSCKTRQTPEDELSFAIGLSQCGRVKAILINEHPEYVNRFGSSLYRDAIRAGSFDIVRFLISLKVDINGNYNRNQMCPLHSAAKYANKYIVLLLIDAGAKINITDTEGNYPIHYAAESGFLDSLDCIDIFERNSVSLQVLNKNGDTLLHSACKNNFPSGNNKNVIEYLIGKGLQVNAQNNDGQTPLHLAAAIETGGPSILVEELLKHGANPKLIDNSGKTALDLALLSYDKANEHFRKRDIIEALKKY